MKILLDFAIQNWHITGDVTPFDLRNFSRMSAPTPSDSTPSRDERINLKDRWLALFLAWLVPGLGHFYQGRRFKGTVFFIRILGTFFSGVCLGDGKSVHWSWKDDYRTYWYPAQFMTGIVAVPAFLQAQRQIPKDIQPDRSNLMLEKRLAGKCEGALLDATIGDEEGLVLNLEGDVEITPSNEAGFSRTVTGSFKGVLEPIPGEEGPIQEKTPVELTIYSLSDIDPPIFPSPHREFVAVAEGKTTSGVPLGIRASLQGRIRNSRSFADYYCAPLDDTGVVQAHGNLGKYFELGMMYTMIAGLLNVLAIWDAFEGPAYGYGDEDEDDPSTPQPATA